MKLVDFIAKLMKYDGNLEVYVGGFVPYDYGIFDDIIINQNGDDLHIEGNDTRGEDNGKKDKTPV